ncbi:AP-3 complex subunit delta-like [Dorcoceras hygrometricum]|uniref:AP-3 complex subunit delta n=1 Tax=Dorcoceras hygrometricum TaxID=472368 RepID=A0A2Z7AQU2_9LAMI|nr:AP-3 complex subunit delta-like [Dorcoceras hygrometricum]
MAAPSLMDSLFQRSLDDLIKSMRFATTSTLPDFIAKSIDEIRREIKSTDPLTKATALQKLLYLHSLHGVDMSWAAFHSIELSSSPAHSHKRVAYLSASLSFDPFSTDVILLLTHQLRKDLTSSNEHDVGIALSTLSAIANADLSRDLSPELFNLLGSGKFVVRKKATACLMRVFEQYPDAVRVCFKRVVENLDCSDVGVLSATVGLFCELAVKEPRSYLPLAPEFYKVLVDCRNNWILIKILKIFSLLIPLEPRLGMKVMGPICEHLERSGAKSLIFECVRTIVASLSEHESALKLAVGKIREFLSDEDPNLKFLGLQALTFVAQKHLWAVMENQEVIVKALSDVDVNIKLEALRLVMSIVSEENIAEICRILITHALKSDPEFCNEILGFILLTCSRNFYEIIFDFDWYVSFLGEMARIPDCQKGKEIEDQLVDIGMRVKDARSELVHVARDLLIDPALLGNPFLHKVLSAAAWVSGEYVELSRNPFELMEALLQPRISLLPPSVRAVYIQSTFKVLAFCMHSYLTLNREEASQSTEQTDYQVRTDAVASGSLPNTKMDGQTVVIAPELTSAASYMEHHPTRKSMLDLVQLVESNLGPLICCDEVDVQERANNVLGLIKFMKSDLQLEGGKINGALDAFKMIELTVDAFSEELGPVSVNAQDRVPVPGGLQLKETLGDLDAVLGDFKLPISTSFSLVKAFSTENDAPSIHECQNKDDTELSTESTSLLEEHRKRHGLYYLGSHDKEMITNDYPPANEPKLDATDETEGLLKLAEQSLVTKKKPNQSKPRPVVVKLDDGEGTIDTSKRSEFQGDLISGKVQEVLLGNESAPSSSRSKSLHKSSKRRENELAVGISGSRSMPGSRIREDHIDGEDSNSQSSMKEKEDDKKSGKKKGRRGKHKSRQRADVELDMEAKSAVIPDFLL